MTEKLLQYIWQFQYYNAGQLLTTQNENIQIISPGNYNTNQGPDFLNAKIKIDDTVLVGSIELHVNSSEWISHKHTGDINYNNVILHVVWHHDLKEKLAFPTLELSDRISNILLGKYDELMTSQVFIPCEKHIASVNTITIISWKERLIFERLQSKTKNIEKHLLQNKGHWEEAFWWLLARNFGTKINSDAFEAIARSISINTLAKNKDQIHKIEALLFGQANLLNKDFEEDYPAMLRKEYNYLQKKYNLQKVHNSLYFLRMRPANFPTIRLAQLAMLIANSQHLFSKIKEAKKLSDVAQLLDVTANDYWHYHYIFDDPTTYKTKTLGKQMVQNILINTVVPILFAYGYLNKLEPIKEKALQWLGEIVAERNNITKGFETLTIENKTALDSQALIQLKNEYCNQKRCLQCAIGNKILKTNH